MYFKIEDNTFTYKAEKKSKLFAQPHIHGQIELILLREGETYAYTDERGHLMKAGDMFVAFPNQVHYYKRCEGANELILVSPDVCPEFLQYFNGFLPKDPVIRGAAEDEKISHAVRMLTDGNLDEFSGCEARGHILILLSEILRRIELTEKRGYEDEAVKNIIIYCYNNYTEELTLTRVADALHISRYYVSHLFSRLGIGFNEYINSLRIAKACKQLKNTALSVSEIAFGVGFGSIRTFNRAFLKTTGVTPRQYRKE